MYLGLLLGYMSKYMQNVKIHVFSSNVTEHVRLKIHLRYIRIHQDTCILQDTCTIHHDTSGLVSNNKPG